MPRKLFGTDGVRGVAGEVLTAELATALGHAATEVVNSDRPQVLIVRDTRESGPMLEAALAAGIAQGGGDALVGGVLPTPAASVLVRRHGLDLAVVVSASHNVWSDNGIKFFGADGTKLGDAEESRIEELVAERLGEAVEARRPPTTARSAPCARSRAPSTTTCGRSARPSRWTSPAARSCSTAPTAPPTAPRRRSSGAWAPRSRRSGTEPDGRNINDGVGSTHPESLAERVVASGAEIGFAFDGDGDRVIAVDSEGAIRDGDELIAIVAAHLRDSGRLDGGIAVTVMTNYGFHQAMDEAGIEVATTDVGDRNVSAALRENDWSLGGEQSGHLIWTGFAPTGDGIAAALLTAAALGGRDLAEAAPFERLPQLLRNVEVRDRDAVAGATALWEAVEAENAALEGRGRVLVRPSGTEPLVRVMVEAPAEDECEAVSGRLVDIVERELT